MRKLVLRLKASLPLPVLGLGLVIGALLPAGVAAQGPTAPPVVTERSGVVVSLAAMGRTIGSEAVDQFAKRVSGHPVTVARVERRRVSPQSYSFNNHASANVNPWTLWGAGSYRGFTTNTSQTPADVEGRLYSAVAGVDYRNTQDVMFGMAAQRANGRIDTRYLDESDTANPVLRPRQLRADFTMIYPFLRSRLSDHLSVSIMAGIGTGTLRISDANRSVDSTQLEQFMMAGSGRYSLRGAGKSLDVAIKADFLVARVESSAIAGLDFIGADIDRLRLAFEAGYNCNLLEHQFFTARFDLISRMDRGEADEGIGLDVGLSATYTNLRNGVTFGGRMNSSIIHDSNSFNEVGLGFTLSIDPGVPREGYSLSLKAGSLDFSAAEYGQGFGSRARNGVALTLTRRTGG